MARRELAVTHRHPGVSVEAKQVRALIEALDAAKDLFEGGCPEGELSIVFMTDKELAQLHGTFLDDPTVTDVITFEGEPAHGVAGEICVSADAALRQAGKKGFARELALYVIHGWLHLAGYDDVKPALKRHMRRAEARALNVADQAKALPRFTLKAGRKSR